MKVYPNNVKNIHKEQLRLGPCVGEVHDVLLSDDDYQKWVDTFEEYIVSKNIKMSVYVSGTFIDGKKRPGMDIDIALTNREYDDSDHEYKLKVRDAIQFGIDEGFKINMFFDLAFYVPYKDDGTWWYSSEEYKSSGSEVIKTKVLRLYDKFYSNDVCVQDFNIVLQSDPCDELNSEEVMYDETYYCKKLDVDLYETEQGVPCAKHRRRIQDGIMYADPKLLFEFGYDVDSDEE